MKSFQWSSVGMQSDDGEALGKRYVEAYDAEMLLLHAVTVIKQWHNMQWQNTGWPQSKASGVWQIYYDNAPEMKPIREALKP